MEPLDGVLLLDKPEGPTSHDMVALARRCLRTQRIGHAGTLDPLATGLLVLMIGKATRLAPFLSGMDKVYRGVLRLGLETDTYDRAGTPVGPPREVRVTREDLLEAFAPFHGTISQTPPIFSAKKVHGTPMYRLARRRRPVSPTPALVTFRRLELLDVQGADVEFEAEVSAGTYLRAFAHDLGQALGCGGHLHSLRRSAIGPFRVHAATTPAGLEEAGRDAAARTIPMNTVPLGLPTLVLTHSGLMAIRHGRPCGLQDIASPRPPLPLGRCCLQGPEGTLVAIGEVQVALPAAAARPIVRPQIVFG